MDYRSQQFPQPCCICFRPAKQARSTRQTIHMAHTTKIHGLVHGGGPFQKENSSPRGGNSEPRHVEYTVPFFAQSFFEGKAFRPLAGSQATSSNFHRNSPIPPKKQRTLSISWGCRFYLLYFALKGWMDSEAKRKPQHVAGFPI